MGFLDFLSCSLTASHSIGFNTVALPYQLLYFFYITPRFSSFAIGFVLGAGMILASMQSRYKINFDV